MHSLVPRQSLQKLFFAGFFLFAVCFFSVTYAHAVAVGLNAFVDQSDLVVLMNGVNGEPINDAIINYELLSATGKVSSARLRYLADGEYRAKLPVIPKGKYTLKLRDTTFPQEALESSKVIQMPLKNPVQMFLPPSKVAQPNVTAVVVLAVLPIVVALVALGLVLFFRAKPKLEAVE
jgi:hypothetical protein